MGRDTGFLKPGECLGQYSIIAHIAGGGMGDVYRAKRVGDFDMMVAIKVLRQLDDPDHISRFEQERRILAGLNHPHIARLLDGGTTKDGRPYIVLEFIEGLPLDTYCEQKHLNVRERLALILPLCDALNYAHQHLILHRDLKPTNILVTHDGKPMLLDFGIAKLLGEDQDAELTKPHSRPMTLQYASPEQIRGQRLTAASDIYALGLILFELVTRRRPYQIESDTFEAMKLICVMQPERPSTAVVKEEQPLSRARREAIRRANATKHVPSQKTNIASETMTGETLDQEPQVNVAEKEERSPNQFEMKPFLPSKIKRELRGAVDAIVLKTLRKDPLKRYASADGLADDIRRHLNHLPVNAQQLSYLGKVQKFTRRNPILVTISGVTFAVVTALAITVSVQLQRVAAENAKTQQIKTFLVDMFQVFDPEQATGRKFSADEFIEAGVAKLDTLVDQPKVQSELRHLLGDLYRDFMLLDRARPLLLDALAQRRDLYGDHHPLTADTLMALTTLEHSADQLDLAEKYLSEATKIRQKQFTKNSPEWIITQLQYADLLTARGNYPQAMELIQSLQITDDTFRDGAGAEVLWATQQLAHLLLEAGRFKEAYQVAENSLDAHRRFYGEQNVETARATLEMSSYAMQIEEYDQARAYVRNAIPVLADSIGEDTLDMANAYNILSGIDYRQGNLEDSAKHMNASLQILIRTVGDDHLYVGRANNNIAMVYQNLGRLEQAETHFQQAIDLYRRRAEPTPSLAMSLSNIGGLYLMTDRLDLARNHIKMALDEFRALKAQESRGYTPTLGRHALVLAKLGQYAEAETAAREALEKYQKQYNLENPPQSAEVQYALGLALLGQGDDTEARTYLYQARDHYEARPRKSKHADEIDAILAKPNLLSSQIRN